MINVEMTQIFLISVRHDKFRYRSETSNQNTVKVSGAGAGVSKAVNAKHLFSFAPSTIDGSAAKATLATES
jgi:hypothetical protein